jgi:serine/threonine protein phosphatase 1
MGDRIIAVGDIHGHAKALAALIRLIELRPGDTLVTLGDYVDRGPDSKGVLDQLIELEHRCHLVPLMGNHEEMMLGAKEGRDNFRFWMQFGGDAALDSYGPGRTMNLVPREHWALLKRLRLSHQSEHHFFVHANYYPNRPFQEQDTQTVLWRPLEGNDVPGRHYSGKTAILGHSPQMNGKVLDLDHLVCIDTGCGHGGLLTALDVEAGRIWQVDETGVICTR